MCTVLKKNCMIFRLGEASYLSSPTTTHETPFLVPKVKDSMQHDSEPVCQHLVSHRFRMLRTDQSSLGLNSWRGSQILLPSPQGPSFGGWPDCQLHPTSPTAGQGPVLVWASENLYTAPLPSTLHLFLSCHQLTLQNSITNLLISKLCSI